MNVKVQKFLLVCFCVIGVNFLYAGTTGKIVGVVTDAATGGPLPAVNITIKGTSMGASSDVDGNYVILNIPPGNYTLRFSIVGYQQLEIKSVVVNVDLTTTVDASLQPSPIEMETTVITAERPLVLKDNTGSLSSVGSNQIKNLPVQNVSEILRLDVGVVEARGRLHIRGGRSGEVAFWVDGVSTTDVYDGSSGIRVENAAIEELQIISGTFNAEYGQAMSGIVNTVTKEGGDNYSGQIKLYTGDYVSSDNRYGVYKKLVTAESPTGSTLILESELINPLKDFNPIYNAEFSLGGPIPFGSKLKFFLTGRYFYDDGFYYGVNWFKPIGGRGDHSIVAMNPNKTLSLQSKLNYLLSSSSKIAYTYFMNKSYRERNYFNGNITSNDYKYVPYGLPQNHSIAESHIVTFNNAVSSKTFYELRVNRFFSRTEQYKYKDPTQKVNYLVIQKDENGDTIRIFNPYTPEGQDTLRAIITRREQYDYVPDPNGPEGYIDPNELGARAPWSFVNKGMDPNHFYRTTSYWVGKFDITSQINKTNEIKSGFEARWHRLTLDAYQIEAKKDINGNTISPFEPAVPSIEAVNRSFYVREPREFSCYIQDKMEFSSIILNVGLRFDYFDANSVIPTDLTDPSIYNPFKYENKYANWIPMPASYRGTIYDYVDSLLYYGVIREYTPDERRAFMHKKVKAKTSLSPRLGFSFPITEHGILHFSYGHFSQIPAFQYLYANPDFKISEASGNVLMGNPDLRPQKTVMYEIGLQQQLSDLIYLNVTMFYRDVRDWVGTSPLINIKTGLGYSRYENKDYENVKGVTVKFERRFRDNFSFRLDYTYQFAEGTYSEPEDAYFDLINNRAPVLALLPLNFDQRHTLNVQLIYGIADWMFSLIGRYWSGLPYTPEPMVGDELVGSSSVSGYKTNSERLPDQKIVDLLISKTFYLTSKLDLQLFVNIYNLFDQRDATSVWGDTGSPDYTTTNQSVKGTYHKDRVSIIDDYTIQPSWYTQPRQIQIGLSIGFNQK